MHALGGGSWERQHAAKAGDDKVCPQKRTEKRHQVWVGVQTRFVQRALNGRRDHVSTITNHRVTRRQLWLAECRVFFVIVTGQLFDVVTIKKVFDTQDTLLQICVDRLCNIVLGEIDFQLSHDSPYQSRENSQGETRRNLQLRKYLTEPRVFHPKRRIV